MADRPHRSTAWIRPSALAAALTAAALAGCSQKGAADTPADPDLAKPAAAECAIAQAALTAIHAAGDDARWRAGAGVEAMSLRPSSQVVNAADLPGYTDDEEDNLRSKPAADWRWCPGMEAAVTGLGWTPMGAPQEVAELGLGRPGVNTAGDEAKVYETFLAPAHGSLKLAAGPWVVTLHRSASGTWTVAGTTAAPRP